MLGKNEIGGLVHGGLARCHRNVGTHTQSMEKWTVRWVEGMVLVVPPGLGLLVWTAIPYVSAGVLTVYGAS